ncbi:UNVERIFIED_CONTAM: hypothetical protein K2H54_042597 [Gekko kuhli]
MYMGSHTFFGFTDVTIFQIQKFFRVADSKSIEQKDPHTRFLTHLLCQRDFFSPQNAWFCSLLVMNSKEKYKILVKLHQLAFDAVYKLKREKISLLKLRFESKFLSF